MVLRCKPLPRDPELARRIEASIQHVQQMSPEAREAMYRAQRRSFVRGQIGMGSDADEAEYAAAVARQDTETLARLDREAAARVAAVDRYFGDNPA